MTDIMKRLEEAQVLYERAGFIGANGAGLMNDAQERIDTLTRERDEWALMVGKLAATIPMKDTIGATGTLGNMLDFFNGREARIDELEAANDAAEKSNRISDHGNLWRFWSDKALDQSHKNVKLQARIDELEASLKHIVQRAKGGDMYDQVEAWELVDIACAALKEDE